MFVMRESSLISTGRVIGLAVDIVMNIAWYQVPYLRTTEGEGGILIQGYRALMQKEARFFELGTMSRSYKKTMG